MKIDQIIATLTKYGKTLKTCQLYRHLKRAGIKPVGARQRPQKYPADTALRLAQYLGLELTPTATTRPARRTAPAKIITLKQIKAGGAR